MLQLEGLFTCHLVCAQPGPPLHMPYPQARLTLEPGSVEQVKRDYGPILLHFVLPGKPSGALLCLCYFYWGLGTASKLVLPHFLTFSPTHPLLAPGLLQPAGWT